MSPLDHPDYTHTALLNPSEGKHAINLALLRWCEGATQVSMTQYELPADATGKIYTLDVFIGKVTGVKYAFWSKGVHRKKCRGNNSINNGKKGKYLTAPHITFDILNPKKKKRIHYRPFIHTLIAYVYPSLREQYAQAAMADMATHNRSFSEACVQVNHIDKNIYNNSAVNLEVITASANSRHKSLTVTGEPYSMLCHSKQAPSALLAYYSSNIIDNQVYVERMCLLLSSANLPINTETIIVGVKSITGTKLKTVDISNQASIWEVLTALYDAKAHHIHTFNTYNKAI